MHASPLFPGIGSGTFRDRVRSQKGASVKNLLIAISAPCLLAACASAQQNAAWQAEADRPAICHTKDECSAMWARAVDWVQDHSAYRFQLQTDNLIQTAGPAQYAVQSAFLNHEATNGRRCL